MGDALKRRCLHLHIPFPDQALEQSIVRRRVPEAEARLNAQLVAFVQGLRKLDLKKVPAISETLDWARTLVLMHARELDADLVRDTLNVLLKYQDDIEAVDAEISALVVGAKRKRSGGQGEGTARGVSSLPARGEVRRAAGEARPQARRIASLRRRTPPAMLRIATSPRAGR